MLDDTIEKIVNTNNTITGIAPVKVLLMNGNYETRWCTTENMDKTYYDDLNSTQQELLQQSYPSMDYDKVIKIHDDKVEKWEYDNGCHISQILKKMQ